MLLRQPLRSSGQDPKPQRNLKHNPLGTVILAYSGNSASRQNRTEEHNTLSEASYTLSSATQPGNKEESGTAKRGERLT